MLQKLEKSKNIIFHGAPGTGKTYLAKQIAAHIVSDGAYDDYEKLSDEQKERIGFVQFHPSYDYTDFVEGLRPVLNDSGYTDFVEELCPVLNESGSMTFKLMDGVFKKFVDKAVEEKRNADEAQEKYNLTDDEITTIKEILEKIKKKIKKEELTVVPIKSKIYIGDKKSPKDFPPAFVKYEKILSEIVKECAEDIKNKEIKMSMYKGDEFTIKSIEKDEIICKKDGFNPVSISIGYVIYMLCSGEEFIKPDNLKKPLKIGNDTRPSYAVPFFNKLKELKGKEIASLLASDNKYVFIIDEINRGEISKIFGELFFSIDPGYRGIAGSVSTQYANLHKNPEYKFYIPENVYIIGTMNDIDRSVDSFDFAMRRRFRFIGLSADGNAGMLKSLGDKEADAKNRMEKLNEQITNTEGLNENYQIGAAYFLKLKEIDTDTLWEDYLEPLLQDYIQGMYNEVDIMKEFKKAYGYTKHTNKSNED